MERRARPLPAALLTVLVAAIATPLLSASPARAQTREDEVARLKAEVEALKKSLAEVEAKLERLQPATAPAPEGAAPQASVGPHPSASADLGPPAGTRLYEPPLQLSRDGQATSRPGNLVRPKELTGFFLLPDSRTWLRIGGYAKLDTIYDPVPLGDRYTFTTATIPVGPDDVQYEGSRSSIHVKQTRLNLDFRRKTGFGLAKIYFEHDFFAPDGRTNFRLRHAYGQLGGITAGLTFSTFMDVDALPDTVDFEGPPSSLFKFVSQLRWTSPSRNGLNFAVALEDPQSEVAVDGTDAKAVERLPDLAVNLRKELESSHVQVSGVLRTIGYEALAGLHESVLGWGLNLSANLQTVGADDLRFQGIYGEGISRYVNDLGGSGQDAVLDAEGNLVALPAWGGFVSYQHAWTASLRSSLSVGMLQVENVAAQPENAFHRSRYGGLNLVWNIRGPTWVALEFLKGWRWDKDRQRGDASRIQVSLQYNLVD